ncbi:MAG: BglG family transcription antiterminator [Clostridiales bacterium]|nr:BglG family transcription antiterminator [Clostridiales bacterium]
MDQRCAQLLNQIMSACSPVKISELADAFNISSRTIRYDLDKIDDFLKDNGLPQLMRKPGSGIEYSPSYYQRLKILGLLESIGSYNYVLTPEERKKLILTELFQAKDFITIEDISNLLSVSRGTVVNDLKEVRKWLAKHELKLKSAPRYGIKIVGSEKDLRKAVVFLLSENIELEKALNLIKGPINRKINVVTDRQLKKLFQDLEISPIEEVICLAEKQLKTTFTDSAYSGLVIHLALAIKRIQLGKNIVMPHDELSKLKLTKEFAVASSMAAELEERYKINIPTAEIGYITIHLLGGKVTESDIFSNQDWIRLQILTDELIKSIGRKLNVNFMSDRELYSGLLRHLEPTVYRLKHGFPLKNPILKEIKNNYSGIFELVKGSLKPLEDYVGTKIPDEEIGFITIHIGAAIERNKMAKNNIYKAVVVCGTGLGTAKLLSSRIVNRFPNIKILATLASRQIKDFINNKELDLIISTVPTDAQDIPQVIVNPLLVEEDVGKILKFLSTNRPKNPDYGQVQTITNNLLKIIEKYCDIKNRDQLIREISMLLNHANFEDSKGVAQPVLKDLLTEKTIKLKVRASNWEEAIRIGGELLVENDFVEQRYVDAMIKNVKEMGPYIVIAPGVAIPHARPEDGVKQACMSLITLEKPVNFGNKNNDPTYIVICLGAQNNHSHLKAISELMQILDNNELVLKIIGSSNKKDLLETLYDFNDVHGNSKEEKNETWSSSMRYRHGE